MEKLLEVAIMSVFYCLSHSLWVSTFPITLYITCLSLHFQPSQGSHSCQTPMKMWCINVRLKVRTSTGVGNAILRYVADSRNLMCRVVMVGGTCCYLIKQDVFIRNLKEDIMIRDIVSLNYS